MFSYKLKSYFYKNNIFRKLKRKLFNKKPVTGAEPDLNESRHKLINKYVKGKSFLDIGCMWGINGYFTFLAEDLGASSSTGFDIYPMSDEFKNTKEKRKSGAKFVQGDINSSESIKELGQFDLVYCAGLLYHVPDPIFTLSNIRKVCSDKFILGTATIPEVNGMKNMAVYYPYLKESHRSTWNINMGEQTAITNEFQPEQGYANWIWGFSYSCLESMLKTVGFEIIESIDTKFYAYVVCKAVDTKFVVTSGDWTVPEEKENVSKYQFKG